MNQQLQRRYWITTNRIQEYDTGRAVAESLVATIAHMLLDCGGKDIDHEDGVLFRVAQGMDDKDLLIVACKSDHKCTGKAMDQLRAYMNFAECPAGLLLSQRRAFFFFQGKDDDEGIQPGPEFSDISKHVPEIADIVRDL
ncbi:hypothetical protein IWQ62_003899 [Dispira parvispora]|uniref:Uncharacterized protein n=1 Tax=Dispira parvispora TaxID=1520584 RepID=A0A9W8ASX6_9FUNG|nr:hypothetical protein IWQ62_003899 [Dispira parvispora]